MNGTSMSVMNGQNEVEELLIIGESMMSEVDIYIKKNQQMFEAVKNNYLEVNRMRKQLHDQAKQSVQALLDDHKQIENKTCKEAEVREMLKQERQLCQEHQSVKQNLEELSAQCKTLKEQHENLLKDKDQVEEEKERLSNETMINLPKRREELSLYNSISRIRWDFDGAQHIVKGYISNKNDVKPFSFDERKCSQFFITNSLWDSMKES